MYVTVTSCHWKVGKPEILMYANKESVAIMSHLATWSVWRTLSTQLLLTRRLPGLMSLCRIPAEWRYFSPGWDDTESGRKTEEDVTSGVIFISDLVLFLCPCNLEIPSTLASTLTHYLAFVFLFFFPHAVGRTLAERTFSSLTEVEKKIKLEKEQIISFVVCEILSFMFIHFFIPSYFFTLPARAVKPHDPLFYKVWLLCLSPAVLLMDSATLLAHTHINNWLKFCEQAAD